MSTCLDTTEGVRARKPYWCALCGERIAVGDRYDRRVGVSYGDIFTMRMHPECHRHEQKPGAVDRDWYEDATDPAFARAEALADYFDPCI